MPKQDKLILVRVDNTPNNSSFRVRVRPGAYKKILELSEATGKSITDMTTELVEFAAERVVLVNEE